MLASAGSSVVAMLERSRLLSHCTHLELMVSPTGLNRICQQLSTAWEIPFEGSMAAT